MLELNKVYNEDCLGTKGMCLIPDKSIDLIIIDPPYNIGKDKRWDKWKNKSDYIEWMGEVFVECQRVLMDNGSFYFFHNDFLQMVELQNWLNKNSKFIFKQLIIWNKKYKGVSNEGFLQGFIEPEGLRNYQKMAEYCLYYTFQDETGLTTIMLDINNFGNLRKYFKELQEFIGINKKQILNIIGQKADHCLRWKSSQWDMPTSETYQELIDNFNIDKWELFQEYESLRQEYESLRQEYESLRYTFNNQKTHHSIWNYEIAKKQGHITPKPVELIENIIKHSSNEGDIILDCFMGSFTTAVACKNTNRNYVGFENDNTYFELGQKRLENIISIKN